MHSALLLNLRGGVNSGLEVSGILIEADKEVFKKLLINRPEAIDCTPQKGEYVACSPYQGTDISAQILEYQTESFPQDSKSVSKSKNLAQSSSAENPKSQAQSPQTHPANPRIYAYNVAIFERDEELQFMQISGAAQMLSGIVNNYHPLHLERIKREVAASGGSYEIHTMQGMRLDSLLARHTEFCHIDYLSIDVEGAEMSVLKSIDFDKVSIQLIGLEHNYKSLEFKRFLEKKGYRRCMVLGCDEFWERVR